MFVWTLGSPMKLFHSSHVVATTTLRWDSASTCSTNISCLSLPPFLPSFFLSFSLFYYYFFHPLDAPSKDPDQIVSSARARQVTRSACTLNRASMRPLGISMAWIKPLPSPQNTVPPEPRSIYLQRKRKVKRYINP